MDESLENRFVDRFVAKALKERVKYELVTPYKRGKALARFSYDIYKTVEVKYIFLQDNKCTIEAIYDIISQNCKDVGKAYYMHEGGGEILPLKEALGQIMERYTTALLIINDEFAFIKTEVEYGSPYKIFLKYKQ